MHAVVFHDAHLPILVITEAWAAHFAVLDETNGLFVYDQVRILEPVWPTDVSSPGFDLSTPIVQTTGHSGRDLLRASFADGSYAVDLLLEDERGPVVHGRDGYVTFGEAGDSFYYSRPRMRATGTLAVAGQARPVDGSLWFDRQWGRDVSNPWLRWDWFSLRLDDGTDVTLYVFRDVDPPIAWGTYIPSEGEPHLLDAGDFVITPMSSWSSPHTGAIYLVSWGIEIATYGLYAAVTAVADDQEVDARASTLNVYWEGLCTVEGTKDGQPLRGSAYVEMTNYVR
jgi:predicted secreted hydrolase